jgi:hypothetical protein
MAEPRKTLVEIRDTIETDLAIAVDTALESEMIPDWAVRVKIVRDLAAALIDVDQVCMARGLKAADLSPLASLEQLIALVWNASQDAGCTTAVADDLVRRVALALTPDSQDGEPDD